MRVWLDSLVGLFGLLGVSLSVVAPAWAENAPSSPGGFPEDWRELDGDAMPFPAPPRTFDFGRDGFGARPGRGPATEGPGRAERRPSAREPAGSSDRARAPDASATRAENLKKALAPHEPPAAARQRALDALFQRLHAAGDPDDAKGVAQAIERIWLQSRSDTADLLMQRALISMREQRFPLALSLLDQVVALEPDWAEAWNQRATTRFLANDPDGAMADIDQVMKLEPRHFGALAGMGAILQRAGLGKRALQIFNRALEIYPLQPDLQATVEKLTIEIEGRDI